MTLSGLCENCTNIKVSLDSSRRISYPHHQHLQDFRASVGQGCYVCGKLWNCTEDTDQWIASSNPTWFPMRYSVWKDTMCRNFYHLNIEYNKSPQKTGGLGIVNFRLVPTEDLPSPTLDTIGHSTSSQSTLTMVRAWLDHCNHSHSICRQATDIKTIRTLFPSRLIDLGSHHSLQWKLCITAESNITMLSEQYLALSYRWGPHPGLKLLSTTFCDFRAGQKIEDLPKTFKDLVVVARWLQVRYLWIDALCIIQDSLQDWNTEALKMRHVYANSLCTVSATVSSDETGGLFRTRDFQSLRTGLMDLPLPSGEQERCRLYERDYWNNNIFPSPLHERGWVFQERCLSPRVLFFGRNQVLWACFEAAKCEVFPSGIPHHVSDKDLVQLFQFRRMKDAITIDRDKHCPVSHTHMPRSIYRLWRNLVRDYSNCSFTYIDDKLIAFAGIAKLFHEATGDQYLAGLWRSRIAEGLDWKVFEPVERTSVKYRAPSWSWISVDGPVRPELPTAHSEYLVSVMDAKVALKGVDPTGAIEAGSLTIKVCLIEADCTVSHLRGKWTFCAKSYTSRVQLFPDHLETVVLGKTHRVKFFPLHSYVSSVLSDAQESIPTVTFIWLELIGDSQSDRYRRIGHFTISGKGDLEDLGFRPNKFGVMLPSYSREQLIISLE